MNRPAQILVLPSWYPDHPGDVGGSFFREQSMAVHGARVRVGVLAPRLTSVRSLLRGVLPRMGSQSVLDGPVNTVRIFQPAWFPRLPSLNEGLLVRASLRAFASYSETSGRPDLVHAHSLLPAGLIARAIKAEFGVPFVVTEHSSAFARGLLSSRQRDQAAKAAASAEICLAVSDDLARTLKNSLGMGTPWRVLPNLVSASFLAVPLRPSGHQAEGPFSFRALGALVPIKGFDILLRAFAKAFRGDPLVALEIGGDGPERLPLENLAAELGLHGQVRFPGALQRSEVPGWMTGGDAFVLSSRIETFGVVAIEALAMGLPVVATRCGGTESIVEPADGVLVPTEDVNAMADALLRMRAEKKNYPSQELRARCAARFGEAAVVGQLIKVYQEAMKSGADQAVPPRTGAT